MRSKQSNSRLRSGRLESRLLNALMNAFPHALSYHYNSGYSIAVITYTQEMHERIKKAVQRSRDRIVLMKEDGTQWMKRKKLNSKHRKKRPRLVS